MAISVISTMAPQGAANRWYGYDGKPLSFAPGAVWPVGSIEDIYPLFKQFSNTMVVPEIVGAAIGDLLRDSADGKCWQIIEHRRKHPDDWFSNEWEHVLGTPWIEEYDFRVTWLEDEFMPRTTAILTNVR